MRTRHHRRTLMAATLGLLALVVAAPPVAAGEVIDKGKTGDYQVYDDNTNADVICRYLKTGKLDRIAIRNPFVHSSDHLSNPNQKQWVGWRVVVERRSPGGGAWSRWYRSGFVKKQATQALIADFDDRVVDVPSTNHQWRVRSIIRWYKPGTTSDTIGTVIYLYDWYNRRKAPNATDNYFPSYCIPEY